ncbi:MAG: NAD-binding protein [Coriobacteriales bacterium]|nr:NAD-binding protein [Coriobacteriales bacterium]
MRLLIVGGGKTGTYLVRKLRGEHEITVIEERSDHAELFRRHVPDVTILRGDGCEPNVLERAGIIDVDLVAALTGDDEDNLVVSLLSKQTFGVPLVFARCNHPDNEWLFNRKWGVDVVVSTASVIESLVRKEVLTGDTVTLLQIHAGDFVIDQLTLPEGASSVGRSIAELELPDKSRVITITSAGEVDVPTGAAVLRKGDELLIVTRPEDEGALRRAFGVEGELR